MTALLERFPRRPPVLAGLLALASLLSCGREITGPENGVRGREGVVAFAPRFASARTGDVAQANAFANAFSDLVPFVKVRVLLRRGQDIVVNRLVDFPSTADSVALTVTVTLGKDATAEGETFLATLDYLNAANEVVFTGGPIEVLARPGSAGGIQPVEIELQHVGPGSGAVFLDFFPDSLDGVMGDTVEFTSNAYDNTESLIEDAVILHTSRDTLVARMVSRGDGRVRLVGARGSTWIVAQIFSGDVDSARVFVIPTATSLVIASGNNQQTLQGEAFASPLRVQVRAADNLGVEGVAVTFAVTSGQGFLDSSTVVTDAGGFAEVTWTAGDSAGTGTVTASIANPALNVVFSGNQLSSLPTSLAFTSQPANIVAGESLPAIVVEVRNGAGEVITNFGGQVALSLTGGTAGASLVGQQTSVAAEGGVATFTDLTVDRGGIGYRVVAAMDGGPTMQSNTFDVTAAPPSSLVVVGGTGQSAPPQTPLTDSIRFLVLDLFEQPVPGVTVTVAGILGGGSVSPTAPVTDGDGEAAVAWTLGEAGAQQITATVAGVTPVNVSATVIGGGPATLFAGYDFTYVPTGGSRVVPVFLSSPSATATVVHLSEQDPGIVAWPSDSVIIEAGTTQIGVPVNGIASGEAYIYLTSALGNDSVFVLVDSAALAFQELEQNTIPVGDSLRMLIRLTHPAPAGGVSITVTTSDSTHFLVAPGTGFGVPATGCLGGAFCSSDLRAVDAEAAVTAAPAGTAVLSVPAGQLTAQLVVLAVASEVEGSSFTTLTATAPGHRDASTNLFGSDEDLDVWGQDYDLSVAIGEGQVAEAYVQRNTAGQNRDVLVSLASDNPAVFTVDTLARIGRDEYEGRFRIYAVQAGAANLIAAAAGYAPETVLVTVAAPAVRVASQSGTTLAIGQSAYLELSAGAEGNTAMFARTADLAMVLTVVEGDTVVALDATATVLPAYETDRQIPFRVIGPGSAKILVEADGHLADSVMITTTVPGISLTTGSPNAGVGQFATVGFNVPFYLRDATPVTLTITSQNPGIARVLTPTVEAHAGVFSTPVLIEGVSVGNVQIIASGANILPLEFYFDVTTPGLTLSGAAGTWDADSVIRSISAFTFSGGSGTRGVMDTLVATLRSSDPSVVEVTDSLVVFAPGTSHSLAGKWRAVGAGTASLTLHAPGYTTSGAQVLTVRPDQLLAAVGLSNVGVGLTETITVGRTSPTGTALPLTITQSGPGAIVSLLAGDTIPPGVALHGITVAGVSAGVDTLVISAAGHAPDTLVLTVVVPQTILGGQTESPRVGWTDDLIDARLSHSNTFGAFAPQDDVTLVLTSLTPATATVLQDTIRFAAGSPFPSQYGQVRFEAIGYAYLVVTDPDAQFPDDTIEFFVEPRQIVGPDDYEGGILSLGMGQTTNPFEFFVGPGLSFPTATTVYLKSSDENVVMVPDSVVVPPYAPYVDVALIAGDTVGSARITASAPGWNEFELDVAVTRSETFAFAWDTYVGTRLPAEIYVVDAITRFTRPLATPTTMRFRSDNPAVADDNVGTFVYPAGVYYLETPGPIGAGVGETMLRVEDTLSAADPRRLLSTSYLVRVGQRELYVGQSESDRLVIGRGMRSDEIPFEAIGLQDSVWVRFAGVGGRFALSADSVLVSRFPFSDYGSGTVSVTGLVSGTDTLVLSAPGFPSDSLVVVVGQNLLEVAPMTAAPTIVVGDSTLVTLNFRDAGGRIPAVAAEALAINVAIDTSFVVSDGSGPVSTLPIPADATSVSFWVKAVQAGSAELVVTSPDFRTFRYVFTTRPLP